METEKTELQIAGRKRLIAKLVAIGVLVLVAAAIAAIILCTGCTYDITAKEVVPPGRDEVDAQMDGLDRPDAGPGVGTTDGGEPETVCTMTGWALGTWQHFPSGGPPDYTQVPPVWLDLTGAQGMVVVATQDANQDLVRIGLVITGAATGGPVLGTLTVDGALVGIISDKALPGVTSTEEEIDAVAYADDLATTSTLTVSLMIGDSSVPTTCQVLTWTGPVDLLGLGN